MGEGGRVCNDHARQRHRRKGALHCPGALSSLVVPAVSSACASRFGPLCTCRYQIAQVDPDAARKSKEARQEHLRQLNAKTKDTRTAAESYCATSRDNVKRLKVCGVRVRLQSRPVPKPRVTTEQCCCLLLLGV